MTADELMTAVQAATLKRLAQAAYELDAFKPNLTRTEADSASPFCPFRKSYPNLSVMQPSQDRNGDNGARSLDGSMQRRIFL